MRSARLTLIAAALVACALLPAAAQARRPVVDRDVGGGRIQRATLADLRVLPYTGGPVLHWNRTHLIFWEPAGSGLTFDPGYQSVIETFLSNVATASRSGSNVYGVTGEYRDRYGPATYDSAYGGAVIATDLLPRNGCTEPAVPTGPGWSTCLTDQQLQHEIERVVRRNRLPTTSNDVYFLVTPNGLGDCEYTGSPNCALGGDVNGYCGYHSQTNDGLVLYAVIPYNAVPGHCQSNNPRPNDSTADPAISTIAHENMEMVTDPLGNAWINPSTGEEMADLCLTNFGPAIGGSAGNAWNEDINGGRYYLQEVWSDYNGRCVAHAKPDTLSFQSGARGGSSEWFAATGHDPAGRIVAYRWFFGDGRIGAGRRAVHRYARAGVYRVNLRTTDSWGNWAYYAAAVTVG